MYSAFSFGKIIKTILPGSLLAGALFVLLETAWYMAAGSSMTAYLIEKEVLTAVGAALVPISLLLGFLLNTFVWLLLNAPARARVDAELTGTAFAGLRAALCEQLQREVSSLMGSSKADLCGKGWPPRIAVEYYFLPAISVDRLTYLWESYFSWYEFHLNTLCAAVIALLAFWAAVLFRFPGSLAWQSLTCITATIVVAVLGRTLWHCAIQNLARYERNLTLLIAGSVTAAARAQPAAS